MKKFIRVLSLILVLTMVMPLTVFATATEGTADPAVTLSVSSVNGTPGQTVQVTVDVSNNPGIASLKFNVAYDSVLTLTNIEFSSAFGQMVTAPEPYTNPQPITMISPLADVSESGVFATLTFTIDENAPDGYMADVSIVYDPKDIFNGEDEQIGLNVVNGMVSVFHGVPGDVNADKRVDTRDAIELFRYVAGWNVEVDKAALNVNGDSSVNTKDAIALFRYVAGWPVEITRDHTHMLTAFEAKEPTCTVDGNIAYWHCANCGGYFTDENGNTRITLADTVEEAKGHDLTKKTEKAASCTVAGNITYWYCETCHKSYSDESAVTEIEIDDTVISATGHVLQHIVAKDVTCVESGNIEYWYCSACECYFADSMAETKLDAEDTVVLAAGHGEHLQHMEAVEATVDAPGNEEYWKCTECGKLYSDSNADHEIAEVPAIPVAPSYTITFVDSKNWPSGNKVKFAQNKDLLLTTYQPPEVAGYSFGGWYTTSTFEEANKKDYILEGNTANLILYAKWTAIEYKITYKNAAENSNPTTYTVENEITLVAPKWAGLIFSHWTDQDGNTVSGIEKGTTGDIELEANWKYAKNLAISNPDKYTYVGGALDSQSRYYFIYEIGTIENVVLDTKLSVNYYGTTTESYSQSCSYKVQTEEAHSAAQTIANSVVRTQEWSNTSEWVSKHTEGTNFGASLCPELEVNKVKVKAYEFSAGYSEIDEDTYTNTSIEVDNETTGTETANQTASSISYLLEEERSSTVTVSLNPATSPVGKYNYVRAADVKVYAIVTYDPNNGEYYLDIYSMVYRVHDTTLFELSGHEQYAVNIESCDQLDFEIPYENIPEMFYTVQYDANGGTGEMLKSVHELGVSSELLPDEFVSKEKTYGFTREGYKLGGWKTSADSSTALYVDKASIRDIADAGETVTLYAHWIPHEYTVSYNPNGGVGSMEDSTHTYDEPKALTINAFTRTGYSFLGWSRDKNATTAAYADKASVTNLSSVKGDAITLYAVWDANEYTVTYNANGGSGRTDPSPHTYGIASSLTANGFSRSGYAFLGWSTNSSAMTPTYTDSQLVENLTTSKEVILYAVWVKVEAKVGYYSRDLKVDDRTYSDTFYPDLDRAKLLANGYKSLKLSITVHGYGEWGIQSFDEPFITIYSYTDQEITSIDLDDFPAGKGNWEKQTVSATISLNDVQTDGSFWIKYDNDKDSDYWVLGTVEVSITAVK